MVRWIILLFFPSWALFAAEPSIAPREYWGPEDPQGFLQASSPPASAAIPSSVRPELQVIPLNKKGFVNRHRRQAEALNTNAIFLQEAARIYSPSQSFVALRKANEALILLHPQSSVSVRPLEEDWQIDFIGDRALARISTHGRILTINLRPADPRNGWQGHTLQLLPGSDLYLKYDRETLLAYVIRGRLTYRFEATRPLHSVRPEGLLLQWEQKQLRRQPLAPYEIDAFAGQQLQLTAGETYTFHIGLPHSETWQLPIIRSSPQLAEVVNPKEPLTQTMLELRKNWLKIWTASEPASKETLTRRLEAGRWEEAYEYLKTQGSDLEQRAMAALCLYRLQQENLAEKKRAGINASSFWADILQHESLRAQLRRKTSRPLSSPEDSQPDNISSEEIYLLAIHEQTRGQWRSALDLWERWPSDQKDVSLQESYKEWQRHLDQKKPWSYRASAEIGWSDNVLHLPAGLPVPANQSHRSTWFLRSSQSLPYLMERHDDFSLYVEPALNFTLYPHSVLADLQRFEPGLALSLRIQLPLAQQSLRFKPYIARLMQGSGGLDRFGYELHWQLSEWRFAPEFSWIQEQNLDFAPQIDHRLDALSGERVGELDRSVRRNTFSIRSGSMQMGWQTWDYRSTGSQGDDRQRLFLHGALQNHFPYDFELKFQGSLHHDFFKGERATVNGLLVRLELGLLHWNRLKPMVAVEREMRQSKDDDQHYNETLWLGGLQYRW
jgi:hypothetical protein